MKIYRLFFVAWALLLVGCGSQADWQRHEFEDERFSIEFPQTPAERVESVDTEGGAIQVHVYEARRDGIDYSVHVFDRAMGSVYVVRDPVEMYDTYRDGALSGSEGELVSEQDVELEGYPGREIQIEIKADDAILRTRLYSVKNRLYVIQTTSQRSKASSSDVERFLGSFQFNP